VPFTVPTGLKILVACVLMACLAVAAVALYRPLLIEKTRLEKIRDAYCGDNDAMAEQISDLKQKQALFATDPDYVEKVARSANRIRPNEIVYVFPTQE